MLILLTTQYASTTTHLDRFPTYREFTSQMLHSRQSSCSHTAFIGYHSDCFSLFCYAKTHWRGKTKTTALQKIHILFVDLRCVPKTTFTDLKSPEVCAIEISARQRFFTTYYVYAIFLFQFSSKTYVHIQHTYSITLYFCLSWAI